MAWPKDGEASPVQRAPHVPLVAIFVSWHPIGLKWRVDNDLHIRPAAANV
jgi:hypothetical protein